MKKIDLHGETFASARREVESFLNKNWGCGERMEIITGHSPKMKKIVTDILDRYGLIYQIGDNFGYNTGIVRSEWGLYEA
jgi:hypothetical protein